MAALTGGVLQEVLHWYELRGRLNLPKYHRLLSSPSYWIITALTVILCTAGTMFWFEGDSVASRDYLVTAAAFGALFKKGVAAAGNNRTRRLGSPEDGLSALRSYFGVED
jgi:hypothetical protein